MRKVNFKNFSPLRGILVFIFSSHLLFAQKNSELALGNQYFQNNELDKAKTIYQKIFKDNKESLDLYYDNYLITCYQQKDLAAAEKLIKKANKTYPHISRYKIDLADLYSKQGKKEEAEKTIIKTINEAAQNNNESQNLSDYFLKKGQVSLAKQLFLTARQKQKSPTLFASELARIYKSEGNTEAMLEELLNTVDNGASLDQVKGQLQNITETKEETVLLRKTIVKKLQVQPDNTSYNELLIWAYVQEKDFYGAFIQSKAFDKRFHLQGQQVMELGKVAVDNNDYENGILCYDYVSKEYKNAYAKRLMINAKEALVKNSYPVDKLKLKELIGDYKSVCIEEGTNGNCLEAKRSQALIYGFYLGSLDTAETILTEVIKQGRFDQNLVDKSKIDLADLYILKGEPWESTLLYMQVQKTQVETTLGHEAKFKDAKLHFYQNEFQLAQSQLDVLKLATSREISNDAIELSLLIQDNLAVDSTGMPLRNYAEVELLLFQNKQKEALEKLDQMAVRYKSNKVIMPQVLLTSASVYKKSGDFIKANEQLSLLISSYPQAVVADEAAFNQAMLTENNLKDKQKAIELYQNFLQKYPSSIYTAEARKRYRILRGDKVN